MQEDAEMRKENRPENPPVKDVESLSSVTECTGLIPSAVLSDGAAEDYAKLYDIHLQKRNTVALGESADAAPKP